MSLEKVILEDVCCDRVFNLPLFEGFLVIDVREPEEFERGHITGAVNLPASDPKDKTIERLLELIVVDLYTPSRWDSVVFYGSDKKNEDADQRKRSGDAIHRFAQMFFHLVLSGGPDPDPTGLQIVQALESLCLQRYVQEADSLKRFIESVTGKCKRIWMIEGGYEAFSTRYPILTSLLTASFENMLPTPARISEHVFVGGRSLQVDEQLVKSLNIKAMILHDPTEILEMELDDKTPQGVQRLRQKANAKDAAEVMTSEEQREYQRVYEEMYKKQVPGVEILYCRGSTELHRRSSTTYRSTIMSTWTQAVDYIERTVNENEQLDDDNNDDDPVIAVEEEGEQQGRRKEGGEEEKKKNVLIFFEGRQRSITIATAWKAVRENISVEEAFQAIQTQLFSLNIKRSPLLDLDYLQSWLDDRRARNASFA